MASKNTLYFMLMTEEYFTDYSELDEFEQKSDRGHGIMALRVNNLIAAVPLRSSVPAWQKDERHLFVYKEYIKANGIECIKALDFSKLTFVDEKYIDKDRVYHFQDPEEKDFYLENTNRIFTRLNGYVRTYKRICDRIKNGQRVKKVDLKQYRFSTLRNFHELLGIEISKSMFVNTLRRNNL